MEKRMLENAMQICNILEFVNEYCEIENTDIFMKNISVCASNLDKWDLEIDINENDESITFKFWSELAPLRTVRGWINIKKVTCEYDLNTLDSYTICNKGL